MLRDLLTSRAILAGLVLFVVVVGGSLLYNWHVQRTTAAEFARTDVMPQPLENKSETRAAGDTIDTRSVDFEQTQTDLEADETESMSDQAGTLSDDDVSENSDVTDAFLPNDETLAVKEELVEDIPVSPYGFGPYPEVPNDFPFTPTWLWPEASRQNVDGLKYHELRYRVLIKLWNEGDTQFTGASINPDTSKVYPSYPNTVYLRYNEDGMGSKTVLVKSGPGVSKEDEAQIIDGNAPPGIQILDYDTSGIDPYTYLDLP